MYIKIPILFLIVKTIYANEKLFSDLSCVYYVGRFEHCIKIFPKVSSINEPYYRLSPEGFCKVEKKYCMMYVVFFMLLRLPTLFCNQKI